jgi:glucose-6-phosphate isomerase
MQVNLKSKVPDIRHLNDMRDVLYDQKWAAKAPDAELYYMYRGIKKKDGLRYDITVIPAKMLGKEFVKTKGHYHIGNYGEVYIVLEGKAIYLMQKTLRRSGKTREKITDVFAVKAKKGDIAVVPPGYGHITINPSKTQELKMANWVSEKCQSDYRPIGQMAGACYYYTEKGWLENKNYKKVPKLRFERAKKSLPKDLSFLQQP